MPGSPATTPRHAIPRYGDLDAADIGAIANSISDRVDVTAPIFGSGLLASRPSAGAGIADRYYYATDAVRPDGSTGVLYRDAGGASPTWSAVTPTAPTAIVTALPGSPVTGQEILFQDATVLGPANILWKLRYDGAKWVPVGEQHGLFTKTQPITTETLAASAGVWQDPATAGPDVTVPVAGDYDIEFGATIQMNNANQVVSMGVAKGAGAAVSGETIEVFAPAVSVRVTMSTAERFTGLTAGLLLRGRYMVSTAAAGSTVWNRWLRVRPHRLG